MRRAAGVTLLESVLSIVVIATVAGACLELRSRSLHARAAAVEAAETTGTVEALMRQATGRLLGDPQSTATDDDGRRRSVWTGERAGDAYEIIVEDIEQKNPLSDGRSDDAPLQLRRYTVLFRGVRAEEVRVRA